MAKFNGKTDTSTIPGRLRALGFTYYAEYLASEHWLDLRRRWFAANGDRCACGARAVQLHHLTYERLGGELLTDLEGVCDSCHGLRHRRKRTKRSGPLPSPRPKRVKRQRPRESTAERRRRLAREALDVGKATGFAEFKRDQRCYRRIFAEAYGPFPHPCHFCGGMVDGYTVPFDRLAAVIHHLDEDYENNDSANLAAAHNGCHSRYHATGRTYSPEITAKIAAKISAAHKGKTVSAEQRAKQRIAMTGRTLTAEHREKIGVAFRGKPGTPHTSETRAKLRAANLGKTYGPETRAKVSAAGMGRTQSPETRAKIREANKGRVFTQEHRARIGAAGLARGPETRAKLRAAQKTRPRASCVKCHREMPIGAPLANHLRVCHALPRLPSTPESRAKRSAAQKGKPRVSCVKCRREIQVGAALAKHIRACLGGPQP